MKRILALRQSPAMAVALCALVVAIGGVAYATIPDSSGTIQGCYGKTTGNLRVVDSAAYCRSNETALAWNQQSPPGAGSIVARARSTEAVQSVSLTPGEVEGGASIRLSGSDWTQAGSEVDVVYGQVEITVPQGCPYPGFPSVLNHASVRIRVDGVEVASAIAQAGNPGSRTIALQSIPGSIFEPGSAKARKMTAEVYDWCADGNHFTVDSVKVDVVSFR
jgi:hypothetical protein